MNTHFILAGMVLGVVVIIIVLLSIAINAATR